MTEETKNPENTGTPANEEINKAVEGKDVKDEKINSSENISEYIRDVKNLAESKSEITFNNSSHKHAAIVLSTMMENAKEEFCIYDDNLSGDIANQYDGFFPAINSYASKGKSLKIVIQNHRQDDTPIYKTLKELRTKYPRTVIVKRANTPFIDSIKSIYKRSINFAVADSTAFRLEETNGDESTRKAICSFNKPKIATVLKKAFDKEFDACEDIS